MEDLKVKLRNEDFSISPWTPSPPSVPEESIAMLTVNINATRDRPNSTSYAQTKPLVAQIG